MLFQSSSNPNPTSTIFPYSKTLVWVAFERLWGHPFAAILMQKKYFNTTLPGVIRWTQQVGGDHFPPFLYSKTKCSYSVILEDIAFQLSNFILVKFYILLHNMWPSATKWGSLRWVSKLRRVLYCKKPYFLHTLMQKWLLYDYLIKSYVMLNIAMYWIIQNNFTEILVVKDCNLCVILWANQEENVP